MDNTIVNEPVEAVCECVLCKLPVFAEDPIMEYQCKCHKVHSRCALLENSYALWRFNIFECETCHFILCDSNEITPIMLSRRSPVKTHTDEPNPLDVLRKDKKFMADLKNVRVKRIEKSKASREFEKKLLHEINAFKEATRINVLSIKLSQKESFDKIKSSEEFNNAKKAISLYKSSISRLTRKYNLGHNDVRALKIQGKWRRLYRYNFGDGPSGAWRFKFGIRIIP